MHASLNLRYLVLTVTILSTASAPLFSASPLRTQQPQSAAAPPSPGTKPMEKAYLQASYGKLPLSFEFNQGQTDPHVRFLSRGRGYSLFLTSTHAVLSLRQQSPPQRVSEEEQQTKVVKRTRGQVPCRLLSNNVTTPVFHHPNTEHQTSNAILNMELVGANPIARVEGLAPLPGKVNYFIGNNPEKWKTNVPTYSKVRYRDVYPGTDLVYYGNQQQLEYDFVVGPGANLSRIRLSFSGAQQVRLDKSGDLLLRLPGGEVRWYKPVVYQEVNGLRRSIRGQYLLYPGRKPQSAIHHQEICFRVGAYDTSKPLVIDPVLAYSTYFGGGGDDEAHAIAVDSAGSAYITGFTNSTETTFHLMNAYEATYRGNTDAFISKFSADGGSLQYSTYLGGSGTDLASGIGVDTAGNAYVTGSTNSPAGSFPIANGYQATYGGGGFDAFVVKLDKNGSLAYSTYLGGAGDDEATALALGPLGNVYVTGFTNSANVFSNAASLQLFNTTANYDAFVVELNTSGSGASSLVYSTYLGGGLNDYGEGIAVDPGGNIYVTGSTTSPDFITTPNAFQRTIGGGSDAFLVTINANGSNRLYATFLGGSGDETGNSVALDGVSNAYVAGYTNSPTGSFPLAHAIQSAYGGADDVFAAKINTNNYGAASLIYSTYLGGGGQDRATGIAVDMAGNAYITGYSASNMVFVTPRALFQYNTTPNTFDSFVVKLNPAGTELYATYLGGGGDDLSFDIALDGSANVYVTGRTNSPGTDPYPNTVGAYQRAPGGVGAGVFDAFVSKIQFTAWQVIDVAAGSDGKARLLWTRADGSMFVSAADSSGVPTWGPGYGPYPGYTAKAIAVGSDGLTRVLWTKMDGTAALWLMGANNTYQASFGFGPYPGWTAQDITVGFDNKARVLWNNADGSILVWSVDNSGIYTYGPVYGPYAGYAAKAIAAGSDGLTRVLWNKSNGVSAVWVMNANNAYNSSSIDFGPYPGWTALDITVGSDNKPRLLWNNTNGTVIVWTVTLPGGYTYGPVYGPYPGFTPRRIAAGSDNLTRVNWAEDDGTQVLWQMDLNNNIISPIGSFGFGPY